MSKLLDQTVFPSEEKTIQVLEDDIYGGAHTYIIKNCLGFNDGKMIPGLQSEQLVYVLLDRCQKLNARFPSPQNEKMMTGLQMFLDACKERVQDRLDRGVMGELKK